jgi:hypothetical protein
LGCQTQLLIVLSSSIPPVGLCRDTSEGDELGVMNAKWRRGELVALIYQLGIFMVNVSSFMSTQKGKQIG